MLSFYPFLHNSDLAKFIDGSHPTPPKTVDNLPNPAYTAWFCNDQLVLSWIIGSTHESYLSQIVGAATALEAWNKLATTYASGSRAQIRLLKSKFYRLQKGSTESISQYVQRAKHMWDQLSALNSPVP
ncbi:hypothetical protein COLO4_13076 [Corchorus olitorius]|uniref:Uncharacterized protein n=1 Tax=Corchorus olitorius TaxID=93759 RepID=A0A1R3JY86_9ROSI|nr:hypothetical protein COLO4_13076 [Corchorus olitorius]